MLKKVLIVGPSLNGLKGGQVTHMANIESVFSKSEHFHMSYFYSSTAKEDGESKLVKLGRLILNTLRFPFSLVGMRLIHLNSSFDDKALFRDLVLLGWCYILGKKYVVQYHGGLLKNTKLGRYSAFNYFWLILLRKAKNVLVLTDEQVNSLHNIGFRSVIKTTNFVKLPSNTSAREEPFNFIFLGRMIKEKGIFDILQAAEELSLKHNISVTFYGDGKDRERLLSEVNEKGLESIIKWGGSVTGKEKEDAYISGGAFLLPTYYPEGMPYSVLESLSYGLPVICTEIGALPQLVKNNENGLLIEERNVEALINAMNSLIVDESFRGELSKNARALIESQYSFQIMKERFHELWA